MDKKSRVKSRQTIRPSIRTVSPSRTRRRRGGKRCELAVHSLYRAMEPLDYHGDHLDMASSS